MLLVNVIKKLQKEGFVRFDGTNLIDGNGNTIDSIEDLGGTSSGGQTLHIAYASNSLGAGFTTTFSTTLEYMAAKALTAGVKPTVNDFSGLWFHRKGLPGEKGTPGTNGVDGNSAGFDVTMNLASVTDENPGIGKIRFNTTTLIDAAEIYLNDESPAGVDLSGIYGMLTTGTSLIVRKKKSETYVVFKLTADASDQNDGSYKLTVDCTAISASAFVEGDACTIQIFGGGAGSGTVTEAAVKAAGNFARFQDNGSGGYELIDNNDVVVRSASPVYRLPGSSIVGAIDLPNANTFAHGAVVRLHQDTLTGQGKNPMGIMIQADATNNKWRPYGRQYLFFNAFGLHASPTVQMTSVGKFTLGVDNEPIIPANLLYAGGRLVFHIKWHKVGTTAPIVRMHFGTEQNTASRTTNSLIYTQTALTTALLDYQARAELDFISTTTARSSNRVPLGGVGVSNSGNGGNVDCTALINTEAAMKLTVDTLALTGDTVNLLELCVAWER